MPSLGVRRVVLTGSAATVLIGVGAPAYAQSEWQCEQQLSDSGGTCVEEGNGQWSLVGGSSDPGFSDDGWDMPGGFGGLFGAFFLLVIVIGVAGTVWRVSTARRLAADAGMDPGTATSIALLDEDGLSATYLASSLRTPPATPAPAPATASAADRLSELKKLLDGGLITQAEYDERRKAVVDSL